MYNIICESMTFKEPVALLLVAAATDVWTFEVSGAAAIGDTANNAVEIKISFLLIFIMNLRSNKCS